MSSESRTKLNSLLREWPKDTVIVYPELQKFGIYQQLVSRYIKSGWLESVGRGAFIRVGDKVDWTGALYALQKQLGFPIHVGGKTAFELMGAAHFLRLGKGGDVWLFANECKTLPPWFARDAVKKWGYNLKYVNSKVFDLERVPQLGLTEHSLGHCSITISTKERAILEVLHLVPHKQTLIDAKYLAEGLMTLRPDVLQQLLERCCSIKVKRLFLFLADLCNLPCFKQLDLEKIDLGKGKRRIGTGGRYISKYLISIPENFVNTFIEEFEDDG